MPTLPLVSICIPLYNAEAYIAETIAKVQQQTYANVEIVIVDDHSTDGSLAVAKAFESERVRIYTNPKKGGNSARNFAFEMSRGEYVKFLDADDYCSDNMIEAQMERVVNEGTCNTVVLSPVTMLHEDGCMERFPRDIDRDYTPGIELLLDMWRGKGWNCPHCHLMHRSLVAKVNGWDESIIKNQDGEFFARIVAASDKVLSVPEETAFWYQTGVGVSTKLSLQAHQSMVRSYDIITDLILNYKDTEAIRESCAGSIGMFVYRYYPSCKSVMPEVEQLLSKLKQPLRLPQRRLFKISSALLGWKLALRLLRKLQLI